MLTLRRFLCARTPINTILDWSRPKTRRSCSARAGRSGATSSPRSGRRSSSRCGRSSWLEPRTTWCHYHKTFFPRSERQNKLRGLSSNSGAQYCATPSSAPTFIVNIMLPWYSVRDKRSSLFCRSIGSKKIKQWTQGPNLINHFTSVI